MRSRSRSRMSKMMSRTTILSSSQLMRQRRKRRSSRSKMSRMMMKRKRTRSRIAKGRMAYSMVLKGKKEKTRGGLTAKDLTKNKYGKIVSKKASAKAKKSPWIAAVTAARSALKLKGFVAVKKGGPLYAKAKSLYKPKSDIELLAAEAAPEEEDDEEQYDEEEEDNDDEEQDEDES